MNRRVFANVVSENGSTSKQVGLRIVLQKQRGNEFRKLHTDKCRVRVVISKPDCGQTPAAAS